MAEPAASLRGAKPPDPGPACRAPSDSSVQTDSNVKKLTRPACD